MGAVRDQLTAGIVSACDPPIRTPISMALEQFVLTVRTLSAQGELISDPDPV